MLVFASFGGGSSAKDYGSVENLLIGLFVLVVILAFKHGTKGMLSNSAVLIGIVCWLCFMYDFTIVYF